MIYTYVYEYLHACTHRQTHTPASKHGFSDGILQPLFDLDNYVTYCWQDKNYFGSNPKEKVKFQISIQIFFASNECQEERDYNA